MNQLNWKDVFNSQIIWPCDYHQCREQAKKVGYRYLAFNGQVFNVDDEKMEHVICSDLVLER